MNRIARKIALTLAPLLIACGPAAADHLDKSATLVSEGRWQEARAQYDVACGMLGDGVERDACLKRMRSVFASAPADTGTATAAVAPSAAPPSALPTAAAAPAPTLVAAAPQPSAYAIVIGVEKYSGGLPAPTGARADAERFAQLAVTSLGISRDHIQTILDEQATKGGILRLLEWAKSSAPAGGRIYFYFSGHGAPDTSAGMPYIVPSDGDPKYLDATAIPMRA